MRTPRSAQQVQRHVVDRARDAARALLARHLQGAHHPLLDRQQVDRQGRRAQHLAALDEAADPQVEDARVEQRGGEHDDPAMPVGGDLLGDPPPVGTLVVAHRLDLGMRVGTADDHHRHRGHRLDEVLRGRDPGADEDPRDPLPEQPSQPHDLGGAVVVARGGHGDEGAPGLLDGAVRLGEQVPVGGICGVADQQAELAPVAHGEAARDEVVDVPQTGGGLVHRDEGVGGDPLAVVLEDPRDRGAGDPGRAGDVLHGGLARHGSSSRRRRAARRRRCVARRLVGAG
jgi:hypothetical protein